MTLPNDEPATLPEILQGFNNVPDNGSITSSYYRVLRSKWDAVWRRLFWERMYRKSNEWSNIQVARKLNERVEADSIHARPRSSAIQTDHERLMSSRDWKLYHNQMRRQCVGEKITTLLCCVEHTRDSQSQKRFSCFVETNSPYWQHNHAELNAIDRLKRFNRDNISKVEMYICWSPCKDCSQEIIKYVSEAGFGKYNFSVKVPSLYIHDSQHIVDELKKLNERVDFSIFNEFDWISLEDHLSYKACKYLYEYDAHSRGLVTAGDGDTSVDGMQANGANQTPHEQQEQGVDEDQEEEEESVNDEDTDDDDDEVFQNRKKIKLGSAEGSPSTEPNMETSNTLPNSTLSLRELRKKWDTEWRNVLDDRLNGFFNGWSFHSAQNRLNSGIQDKHQSFHVCPEGPPLSRMWHQLVLSSACWKLFHNQLRQDTKNTNTMAVLCCVEMKDATKFCYGDTVFFKCALWNIIQRLKCFQNDQISKVEIYSSWSPCQNACNQIIRFVSDREFKRFSVKFSSIYLDYTIETMTSLMALSQKVSVSVFDEEDWTHLEYHLSVDTCSILKNEMEERRTTELGDVGTVGNAGLQPIPTTPMRSGTFAGPSRPAKMSAGYGVGETTPKPAATSQDNTATSFTARKNLPF